ncbi:MAG TPA: YggS family pyridoxal phosphate-dependent enzyme [Bacteroidales bacterium]|nr:YggS family pyridoxal phosphate-dependent enzyme [Bacteroidales bacterium]
MNLVENVKRLKAELPDHIKLIAVSKTKSVDDIKALYDSGHRMFGENKVQELTHKAGELPDDIEWHMIGHLQSNKVKYITPFVHLIHSVDSLKLLKVINKEARKNDRVIDCLLQVHIAEEETKFGFSSEEVEALLGSGKEDGLDHIRICGMMGMATFTRDEDQVRREFRFLKRLFDTTRETYFSDRPYFEWLSMGMSNDYRIAIEEGSNMLRIGSLIFGERYY